MKNKYLKKTFIIGALIGILNALITTKFLANRPIGASTSYPYVASHIFNLTNFPYYKIINQEGKWEFYFLLGTFTGALISAFLFKNFKVKYVPKLWIKMKGDSKIKRLLWAFVGGFLLILGARLADGCTSGHILSGGMELAISSLVFAILVFISFIITANLFYKKDNQ